MRTSVLAASLAFLTYASGQSAIAGLPECAKKCLEPFANKDGIAGCGAYNIECICSSSGFLNNIGCCLKAECSDADQAAAIAFAVNICKTAGVIVPSEIPCEASGSSTADSAGVSSSVSSAISSATVTSEFISSKSESSESLANTLSATDSAATAATTSDAGAASPSESSVADASTSAAPNGASLNVVGGSGVLGGLFAALALL